MTLAQEQGDILATILAADDPCAGDGQPPSLTIRTPSPHQVQVMQDGKVLADWWPSKGTTMMDGRKGPKLLSAERVAEWLREV